MATVPSGMFQSLAVLSADVVRICFPSGLHLCSRRGQTRTSRSERARESRDCGEQDKFARDGQNEGQSMLQRARKVEREGIDMRVELVRKRIHVNSAGPSRRYEKRQVKQRKTQPLDNTKHRHSEKHGGNLPRLHCQTRAAEASRLEPSSRNQTTPQQFE